jgi:hypothetical protein
LFDRTKKFWSDLASDKNLNGSFEFKRADGYRPTDQRPRLTEAAGSGRYKELEPGWLWERALKATEGNPNDAMAILAMCANDDWAPELTWKVDGEAGRSELEKEVSSENQEIADYKAAQKGHAPNSPVYQLYQSTVEYHIEQKAKILDKLVKKDYSTFAKWNCPLHMNSPVFAPQSLDGTVDLSSDLKARIEKLNGRDRPAKSYHFFAGAYMGCQLAKCGMDAKQASTIAGYLAKAYRVTRLCSTLTQLYQKRTELYDKLQIEFNDPRFPKAAEDYLTAEQMKFFSHTKQRVSAFSVREGQVYAESLAREQARAEVSRLDALQLYLKRFPGGPDSFLPCVTSRLSSAEAALAPDWHAEKPTPFSSKTSKLGTVCNETGWSIERCDEARRRLATWDVDEEWTVTQHQTGAAFGASKCKAESAQPSRAANCAPIATPGNGTGSQSQPASTGR